MPKGALVYNGLVEFMRRIYQKYQYQEVITPQVLDVDLWHTSGHYEKYKENMYFTQIDEREFALKPMNCPCHMLMFSHHRYSYRDLPLRFADFGRLHRYEKSGVVAGLTRVRTFCQDDAHIFIQTANIQDEIKQLMEMFFIGYEHFGFKKIKIGLSTRPEMRVGSDETWDNAEAALKSALDASGKEYFVNEGDGAFYGPKIDIQVADALGRYFQLGTIQLDFQLPDRFDLKFTNQNGEMERPVVIHRALLGSLERFFGVYLEHIAGAFPFWLAPEQAVIIPVKNELHLEAAQKFAKDLSLKGFRVKVDDRNESMGLKTRQAQTGKIPFMLVLGDKEIETQTVSVRRYGEQKSDVLANSDLFQLFETLDAEKVPAPLRGV
jgi:threonyl-tRNA synthetase